MGTLSPVFEGYRHKMFKSVFLTSVLLGLSYGSPETLMKIKQHLNGWNWDVACWGESNVVKHREMERSLLHIFHPLSHLGVAHLVDLLDELVVFLPERHLEKLYEPGSLLLRCSDSRWQVTNPHVLCVDT